LLERYKAAFRKNNIRGFSSQALSAIESYSWPGNVRELENKLQRAIIMSDGGYIEPYALGLGEEPPIMELPKSYETITLKEARRRLEIELIETALHRHKGNIKSAAEELGVSRPTLYDLITKYGLNAKYPVE
jgi:two-component system NtrC family response regulator